jgi:hypothetical protein
VLGFAKTISRFLAEHRLASFIIAAVVMVLWADAVRRVLPDHSDINVFTWVALALMVYAMVALIVLPKRVMPSVRSLVAWGMAISPSVYGVAAALAGSPMIVMWIGVVLSILLSAWVAITGAPGRNA